MTDRPPSDEQPPTGDRPPAHDQPRRSGLRNPRAAARALGALTLVIEAVVLLLAIAPLRMLGGPHTGAAITSVLVLAVAAVTLAALLRYNATWYVAGALHLAVTLAGFFQWTLGVLGVVFALVWWYVLHVRRTLITGYTPPPP